MKQFRTLISITLAMILGFTGFVFSGVNGNIDVAATAIVCDATLPFEVSVITTKDVYSVNSCHATLEAAQATLITLSSSMPNVVVRHPASHSPSKIIAMDRGIAVTYDYRSDATSTVNLYSNYDTTTLALGGTTTYTQNHRDMQYLGTMGYSATSGTGVVKIKVSGFMGYINLKNTDLIPMIYLDNSWAFTLGGTTTSTYVEVPFTTIPKMNRYIVSTVTYGDINKATKTTRDLGHEHFSMWDSHSYGSFTYGPAPVWLPNGTYYSWDGIVFYTDRDCKNPVKNGVAIGRYYQYYQYLSLRSDTKYTGAEINAYVEIGLGYTKVPTSTSDDGSMLFGQGDNFISSQTNYGMNALLVFALAYHESGGGTSAIAITKFNLFGWGAVDSNPYDGAAVFSSIAQSIDEMMGLNLRGYISPEGWRFFGSVFGSKTSGINVKYASDLYWGEKIAGRAYKMDRWLGNKDYGTVDYAIINDNTTVNVEKTEGTDTTNLYTLSSVLKDESLILQPFNRINGKIWARTPTTMPLSANGIPITYTDVHDVVVLYDRAISKGFLITNNYNYLVPRLTDGKTTNLVQTLAWNVNKLSIAGYGFVNGYNISNTAVPSYTLKLTSITGTTTLVLESGAVNEQLTTDFGQNLVSYDGATYNNPAVDLSALAPGTYTFGLTLAEYNYGISTDIPFNYAGVLPTNQIINGKHYVFTKLPDGTVVLTISYAILIADFSTAPTNKDITVTASAIGGTLNATSHTFTENGSFTFILDNGAGGTAERIITISNIDKVAPIITIAPYPTEIQNTSLTVSATTNEGTLNTASHTFQYNGSFNFIATDAVGNVSTKTVSITNIDKLLPVVKVIYQTHVQNVGWQEPVSDGAMSGTSGNALRLEAINIQVTGNPNLGITYSTHIQNIGWQTSVANGANSGTLGKSLRLEAIKIELTGSDAINYDVYYRVHAQNFGWLDWAMNGKAAGTEGYGYRLEAINIIIVPKGTDTGYATTRPFVSVFGTSNVIYSTHVQNVGWQAIVKDGAISGTSGRSLRLEGIKINLGPNMPSGSITYATHVQDYGWMTPVSDGAMSGTSGQAKRLEAIQISLSGEVSAQYDVYYRVHAQNFGWLGWAKNGASAGTAGYGYRLEAIEIVMVLKDNAAPGSTSTPFIQK